MRFRGINIRLLFSLTFFSVFLDGGIIVGEGIGAGVEAGGTVLDSILLLS
jgi:hypothetical protein